MYFYRSLEMYKWRRHTSKGQNFGGSEGGSRIGQFFLDQPIPGNPPTMNPLPPVNNTKRKNYTHRQRSIDLPSKLRAQNYFKNSVTPTLNTFLQSVSAQQPEDVLAFMFAWSRRELSERKLRVGRPEVEAYFVDEQQQPQQEEEEEDDSEAQSYAAAKIQARHRGRQQRSRVKKIKQQNAAEIRGATVIQANQRGRKSRRDNNPKKSSTPTTNNQTELLAVEEAPPQQSKAGKMEGC